MSDFDDDWDAGTAEAEHWAWEDRQRDELAITQHLEELEANEAEARARHRELGR